MGRQRFAGRLQGLSLRLFDGRGVGVGAALDAWWWDGTVWGCVGIVVVKLT